MEAPAEGLITARVREADPARYLSVLFAPAAMRDDLLALYAFDAEIAQIPGRVSEPLPGEIRLQWWRDALARGAAAAGGNPVAEALLTAIMRRGLPADAFERYLDARIADLYADPFPDRASLEAYCGETESAIVQLAALILSPNDASAAAEAAGHAGCARAMTRMLSRISLWRARGRCPVPLDLLAAAGIDLPAFLADADPKGARRAAAALHALASHHLRAFEAAASGLPQSLRPALLPAAELRPHLSLLERRDPLPAPVELPALRRFVAVSLRGLRGW